ncbi:hypothetical protein V6N13_147514 [Hibiscus sabdariffa]|uniref:NB-ARC domain-containing protein n=1 Tax=Hibiscus sabdariffa TaxID=183260 RepID=A0ABR2TVK8_9ROSI
MTGEHISAILKRLDSIMAKKESRQQLRKVMGIDDGTRKLQQGLLDIQTVLAAMEEGQLPNYGFDVAALDRVLKGIEYLLGCFNNTPRKKLRREEPVISELNLVRRKLVYLFPKSFEQSSRSSFMYASKLYGRHDVKKEIVKVLLGETSKDKIETISVLAMEGMGKTSLARCICDDDRVSAYFDNIIWVNVSGVFDLEKIARTIVEALGGLELHATTPSLRCLLRRIHGNILKKKSLLVLDDVERYQDYNIGDHWGALKAVFQQAGLDNRIIVTTREPRIALRSSRVFRLEDLSDEFCQMILHEVSFARRDDDIHEYVEDVEEEIAKRCEGLPFAAKVLGTFLQHKTSREEWNSVLKILVQKREDATKQELLDVLKTLVRKSEDATKQEQEDRSTRRPWCWCFKGVEEKVNWFQFSCHRSLN